MGRPGYEATYLNAAGNKKKVNEMEVMIEKKACKPSGIILSKKPYVTDKAEVLGVRICTISPSCTI